jgi:integrase
MPYVFKTYRADGTAHARWRFQYTDWRGKRRTATGTTSEPETLKIALRKEADEYDIRKGIRPPKSISATHAMRDIEEIIREYIAWGGTLGGRRGRSWSRTHARMRAAQLQWWVSHLKIECLADLPGILPKVESGLRSFLETGRTRRTTQSYAETLHGFCRWCLKREYLNDDPLRNLIALDTTPQTVRRSLDLNELRELLDAVPYERRLVYQVALCSGLRAGELRALTVDDLDLQRGGLVLRAAWTKNRTNGFQPLPKVLVNELATFVGSGTAARLYQEAYVRKDTTAFPPERPLLYLPSNTSRAFRQDLAAASIAKNTEAGKLDFHALRVTYVTLLLHAGAYIKEAQSLARHSDPKLTMNVYARVLPGRLIEVVEAVGRPVLGDREHNSHATAVESSA